MIRFNVFGRFLVGIEWRADAWKTYILGNEGKRRDADFIVPPDVSEEEIGPYLAVLFHESATPERRQVLRLE